MSRGKGRGKASRRGGRHGVLLAGLILVLLAIPTAAAIVAWQTGAVASGFRLEWPRAFGPAATPAAATRPPARAAPTTVPGRQEATPVAPTKVPGTPTARPAPSPTVAAPAKVVLNVPIYRQEHALTCEAAAIRMAMGAFGTQVSEDSVLASLARDPTPRKVTGDSVEWGDPDTGFVGSWDGEFLKDGYGVYEQPLAEVARGFGFQSTRYGKNVDPKQLYAAVRDGLPSVVWMPYDLTVKGRGSWVTPAGKRIPYVVTEHAVVLAGIDDRGVYYADPLKPELQFATFSAFEQGIAELGRRYVTVGP